MQITSIERADGLELKLQGRMDAGWSDHVACSLEECLQAGQHSILLDMSEVDYISSAGIRILVLYAKKLKLIQGDFSVINASRPVRRVLELSGLESLFASAAPRQTSPGQPQSPVQVEMGEFGATAELFELEPEATLRVHWPGKPQPWLAGHASYETCVKVEFPLHTIGIGLGGFSDGQPGSSVCLGEFLAAAGAAVCLPADGSNKPDYMLQEGALTPTLQVAYAILGVGSFRQLLRFDKGPQQNSLPLSSVVNACLKTNAGQPLGFVMVAETASLIGAFLQRMPSARADMDSPNSLFTFPAVRDWLSFTAEPAFLNTTSLVVGFAARRAQESGLRMLNAAEPSGELQGHFHAAAFPYQPLRKGKLALEQAVRPLFESGQILGLLHLLNDWREISGAGESRFLRGACWWAPALL